MRRRQRKTDRLLRMLRGLALKQQKDRPQLFLSLREAARRFGVPTSAMATVYKQLSNEGVLSAIRGSHTMLQKRGAFRNLNVRGVIGMPVSLSRFQALQDYCRCFLQLRDELHAGGFLTSTIFFEQPEGKTEAIIERLKKAKVDSVIWLLPDAADRDTMLRLRDLGIRFLGISITPLSGMVCRYQVRRQQAIREIMRSWKADPEIHSATIVRVTRETTSDQERLAKLRALIRSEKIECEMTTVPDGHISAFLKALCENKVSGVVLPAPAASLLAWHGSDGLVDFLRTCRVALVDGPIGLPLAEQVPKAEVDLITVNWPTATRQIARDIITGKAFQDPGPTVFEAEPHVRVALEDYAQEAAAPFPSAVGNVI